MSPRFAPVLAASLVLVVVGACSAATAAPATSAPATSAPGALPTFRPTPRPTTPAPAVESPSPNAGDVSQGPGPLLSVEFPAAETITATLQDPAAKAWRFVIAGTGARAGDRFELVVETGDIAPTITATDVRAGKIVEVRDLSGFGDGAAGTPACHGTLPVCAESTGFRLPANGDGTLSVRLTLRSPATPLMVTGATATWPGEPFLLGPWTVTESFPWGG